MLCGHNKGFLKNARQAMKTQVKKTGVKILCSKSWEGQNSMKVKILFFSRGTLGQNSMFPEKRGQNSIFFPSALKKGGQNRGAYQPTSLKGCPPPPPPRGSRWVKLHKSR